MRPDSFRLPARSTAALIGLALVLAACNPFATTTPTPVAKATARPTIVIQKATTLLAPTQLPKLVARIDFIRSRVRDDVFQSIREANAPGAKGPRLGDVQAWYSYVRANFNAWIKEYQTAVDQGLSLEATNTSLQTAVTSADQMLSFTDLWHKYNAKPQGALGAPVGGALGGPPVKDVIEFAVGLLPDLIDAGSKVWDEKQKVDEARQQEIIRAIGQEMWPTWENLK